MANLTRYKQKIFANNSNQVGVFGTGTNKVASKNVETLQSADYEDGWSAAIITDKNYPIWQERDGVDYGFSYQLAYLMQKGIPDWLSTETYYQNDYCKVGNVIYYSLQDNNIGQNPSSTTGYWKVAIVQTMIPDWDNGITQTSTGTTQITYTCPDVGFVNYSTTVLGTSNTAYVKVNDVVVNRQDGKSVQVCQELTGGLIVNKNDVIKIIPNYASASSYLYFFPLKGV